MAVMHKYLPVGQSEFLCIYFSKKKKKKDKNLVKETTPTDGKRDTNTHNPNKQMHIAESKIGQ